MDVQMLANESVTPHAGASSRRMTAEDYERERTRLRAVYGDNSVEAGAHRDQELARLFVRSGWTQEELAKAEGCKQPYIAKRLLLGRFLSFIPNGIVAKNLTVGRFGSYWEQTDKTETNERIRFREVQRLVESNIRLHKSNAKRPDISGPIIERFADGAWHKRETIMNHLGPDVDAEVLDAVLINMAAKGRKEITCEREKTGASWKYRIRRKGRQIDYDALLHDLGPILEELKAEGKKNAATACPPAVAILAVRLEQLLERLAK